jgi:hypothetical protein
MASGEKRMSMLLPIGIAIAIVLGLTALISAIARPYLEHLSHTLAASGRMLPVGATGRLHIGSAGRAIGYPCFQSQQDLDAVTRAALTFNPQSLIATVRGKTMLVYDTRLKDLSLKGFGDTDMQTRVLAGPLKGRNCWMPDGAFFVDVQLPGQISSLCVDEPVVIGALDELASADATGDTARRSRLISAAERAIMSESEQCPSLGAPDDLAMAYAWAEAEDGKADAALSSAITLPSCKTYAKVIGRRDVAVGWIAIYLRRHTTEQTLWNEAASRIFASSKSIGMSLPRLTVSYVDALRFESDIFAEEREAIASARGHRCPSAR